MANTVHDAVLTVQKQEMTSSIILQHYDVTSCKQPYLILNIIDGKKYQFATAIENLEKFPPQIKEL